MTVYTDMALDALHDADAWPTLTTPRADAQPIERWRPVPGWDGLYRVSDQGSVWSCKEGRRMARIPWVALQRDGTRTWVKVVDLVAAVFGGTAVAAK